MTFPFHLGGFVARFFIAYSGLLHRFDIASASLL
jgi:hypothetical protein